MKRLCILVISLGFFLSSCNQKLDNVQPTDESGSFNNSSDFSVSESEAKDIAAKTQTIDKNSNLRIKLKKVKRVSRFDDELNFETLFYLFEYEYSGFAIIAADKRYSPVLAFSDDTVWESDTLGGIKEWIFATKEDIRKVKAKFSKQNSKQKKEWEIYSDSGLSNMRTTNECGSAPIYWETGRFVHNVARWSQSGSFRYYSPTDSGCSCLKKSAGCGALAMAMLMKYYQYPQMNMSFNGESLFSDYASMSAEQNYSCDIPSIGYRRSAMLIRLCGSFANSGYGVLGNCSTFTYWWNIDDALKNMGYNSVGDWKNYSDNYSHMISDLRDFHPVIFTGTLNTVNLSDWHIWIGDGLKTMTYSYYDYSIRDPECISSTTHWIGMNWGWGGSNNGWFIADGIFDTTENGGTNNGKYDTYIKTLTGIRP